MEVSCHVLVHVDGCSTLDYQHKRRRWQEADEHRPSGYERIVSVVYLGCPRLEDLRR